MPFHFATEIPVVAGSASWAELALASSGADIARRLSMEAKAPVRDDVGAEAEGLFQRSGIPDLIEVLTRLTVDCHTGHLLIVPPQLDQEGRAGSLSYPQRGRAATTARTCWRSRPIVRTGTCRRRSGHGRIQ